MRDIKNWVIAASVRAIKTVAQTCLATIGTTVLFSQVDWLVVISSSLFAGLLSMLTSVAGLPELENSKKNND